MLFPDVPGLVPGPAPAVPGPVPAGPVPAPPAAGVPAAPGPVPAPGTAPGVSQMQKRINQLINCISKSVAQKSNLQLNHFHCKTY